MRLRPVAFWKWNKRTSVVSMTPGRVASRKLPFNVRVLQSLSGKPLYHRAQQAQAQRKRALRREWDMILGIHRGLHQ